MSSIDFSLFNATLPLQSLLFAIQSLFKFHKKSFLTKNYNEDFNDSVNYWKRKPIDFKSGKIDMSKEMVLFCAGGLRSALAAKSLKEMGFEKVSHIDGGFSAIKQSKFKIV